MSGHASLTVVIASPLDPSLAERIRDSDPDLEVLFDPDLLPTQRYPNDHSGDPSYQRDARHEEQLRAWLSRAEVVFGVPSGGSNALGDLVRRAPHLGWVQGTAAGFGQQVQKADLDGEALQRVTFTSSVGVHAVQLAEWAMLGLLAFTKDLPRLLRDKESRSWDHYPVRELHGQRLLVVGLGHIGREVSRSARALGMRVTGMRRCLEEQDREVVDDLRPIDELPEVVPQCDAVVLALPETDATRGLFSRALIEALPPHAILVNVGRGTTVDEPALVDALQSGRLAGAALDVFAEEPLPQDSPLWTLENVLISPHTAALSMKESERIVDLFVDNLARYRDGRTLRNVVDTEHFY